MSRTELSRKERAINIMQCRMPWSEAELYATELDLRGLLDSGDAAAAIAVLNAHMSHQRATAIIRDLAVFRAMRHDDYA